MKFEENIAKKYLTSLNIGEVIFEPDGNIPPDFTINNQIAIEVRRLNQHFFNGNKIEALEQLNFPIWDAFKEVLESFDKQFQGSSYLVGLHYERPLEQSMKELKHQMKNVLKSFLSQKIDEPIDLQINGQVSFYIGKTNTKHGKVFLPAGRGDMDAGGFLVSIYIDNINFSIQEKNIKIRPYAHMYKEWWLLLVDAMAWGLSQDEMTDVKNHLRDLEHFQHLFVINQDGQLILKS